MPERRDDVISGPGERPETAPAASTGRGLAVQLKTLRQLTLAFLREVDSITGGGLLEAKPNVDFSEEVGRFEADLIRWALTRTGGHQRRAARLLNLKVTTLNALIKRHRINPRAFKAAEDTFFT
jgi:transcriptional regulator with GAF, ATPase, and Fis domain